VDGKYAVGAEVQFASNATGRRLVQLLQNGSAVQAESKAAVSGEVTALTLMAAVNGRAGDYLQVQVLQTSGGSLNVSAAALWAVRQTT
jgi:hypothetical protein